MTWQGVPWFVKDAEHAAEVERSLAYIASQGGNGIVLPTDCKVTASAIPDLNVNVAPGAVVALNAFAGGGAQAYIARNVGSDVKALVAQGSSGVRYDLVALIVEDPQYAGQPAPPSVPNGPYVRTAVYSNVASTVKTLAEVAPNQTGVALALVKFDASDGTINPADITDLRVLASPRQKTVKKTLNGVATASFPAALATFPAGASWAVPVPSWAKRAIIEARWSGLKYTDTSSGAGSAAGGATVAIGTAVSSPTQWAEDATASNKPVTGTVMVAEDVDVASMAGTTVNLQARLSKTAGTGMTAQNTIYTTVVAEVTFYEQPV